MHHLTRRARALLALALVGSLGLAACGDDDESPAASGDAQETEDDAATSEGEAAGETVEVVAVEYEFRGLDGTFATGTELTLSNEGEEAHELIVVKRLEGETRPVEELIELSDDEVGRAVEIKGVAVANPGEEGEVVNGELVLDEPGEYIAVCFVPVGTTDLEAAEEGDEDSAPPHAAQGMVAEFTVE